MLAGFVAGDPGFQFTEIGRPGSRSSGSTTHVGVDGLSIVLVVLTTTLTWISILASFGPIQNRVKEYMISFLVLEVGMIGVFVAHGPVPVLHLLGAGPRADVPDHRHLGRQEPHLRHDQVRPLHPRRLAADAGRDPGDRVHLPGGARRQLGRAPSTSQALAGYAATGAFGGTFGLLAFGAFFLAFAIKVPMFPFHTWLPDAHVEAPTAGSVILAGVLLKLGGYGFIRFALPLFPEAAHTWAPLIIVLSLIAIIYGAIVALVQPDLKKLVAYSSVSATWAS